MTAWRRQPEPLAVARPSTSARSMACCRRSWARASTTRPSCGRRRFWEKVYEPFIRRAAGLGRASYEADPDGYDKSWAHCDLLVVGAGPDRPRGGAVGRAGRRAGDHRRRRHAARRHAARRHRADRRRARSGVRAQHRGRAGGTAERPGADPHHGLRLVRLQRLRRGRTGAEACGGPGPAPSARAAVADRGARTRSSPPVPRSGRWSSAATTGRA